MSSEQILLIGAAVALLLFLLAFVWLSMRREHAREHWTQHSATVGIASVRRTDEDGEYDVDLDDVIRGRRGGEEQFRVTLDYLYLVDGKTYSGHYKAFNTWLDTRGSRNRRVAHPDDGRTIRIRYNPANPAESIVDE